MQPDSDAAEALRFQTGRVATVAGGHAVHDTYVAFLPPLLPVFVERWALSNTSVGILSAFDLLKLVEDHRFTMKNPPTRSKKGNQRG